MLPPINCRRESIPAAIHLYQRSHGGTIDYSVATGALLSVDVGVLNCDHVEPVGVWWSFESWDHWR
jgi:hypothetical protein